MRDDLLDVDDGNGVNACERLVQQDEGRVGGQGAADLEAPPFSPGEGVGGLPGDVTDAELVEQLTGARMALPRRHPAALQHGQHVLLGGEAAEDARLLRQVPDSLAGPHVHGEAGDVVLVQEDVATVGAGQPDHHVERRGLARAVRAEQPHHLPRADVEVHVLNDDAPPVRLGERLRLQDGAAVPRAHSTPPHSVGRVNSWEAPV